MEEAETVFLENDEEIYPNNPVSLAFMKVIKACEGAAAEAGFQSEEEMQRYLAELRRNETLDAILEVREMKKNPDLGKIYDDVDQMMEELLVDVK